MGSEDLEVIFEDDFDLVMSHLEPTPFDLTIAQAHSLGTLDDLTFGKSSASFYVRPFLDAFSRLPNFAGGTLDSMVLALKVDTSRFYGDPRAFFDIEVFELTESIDDIDTFRSDQEFMFSTMPVGVEERLIPEDLDSIPAFDPLGDTTYFRDVVTVRLDRAFSGRIFNDTARNSDPGSFPLLLDGFYVKATSNNSLIQLNLMDEISSMLVYFKDSTGLSLTFPYRFGIDAPLNFTYDLSGSRLEAAINDPNTELFYVQGHGGTMIEVDLEDVKRLGDPFINHVSFEVFGEKDGIIDTSRFALPFALDLLHFNDNGELESVIDLAIGQNQGQTRGIFDGDIEIDEDEQVVRYEMNITTHVKQIIEGAEPSKVFIAVRNRTQTPNNLIIYGPNHPIYPARLKLTYTKS